MLSVPATSPTCWWDCCNAHSPCRLHHVGGVVRWGHVPKASGVKRLGRGTWPCSTEGTRVGWQTHSLHRQTDRRTHDMSIRWWFVLVSDSSWMICMYKLLCLIDVYCLTFVNCVGCNGLSVVTILYWIQCTVKLHWKLVKCWSVCRGIWQHVVQFGLREEATSSEGWLQVCKLLCLCVNS